MSLWIGSHFIIKITMLVPRITIDVLKNTGSVNCLTKTVRYMASWHWPKKQGLYDPSFEKEGCGVAFAVSLDGRRSNEIIAYAKKLSLSMKHRGAFSYDNQTGDGAGILTTIPHELYASQLKKEHNLVLPGLGKYATGIVYVDKAHQNESENQFNKLAEELDLSVLAWRTVSTDNSTIGEVARNSEPIMRQVFVNVKYDIPEEETDLKYFILRKRATHSIPTENSRFYICSLSPKLIVYKGQLSAEQLWTYFPDLVNPMFQTYMALVHTRFSTNTFPSWERAHPFRMMAHNGEINTLKGNVNCMKAREGAMESTLLGDQLSKLYPIVEPDLSDSGSIDCVLEFLIKVGKRSLPEAIMTIIPEAWHNDKTMSEEKINFYKWSACNMESWDGPALITFTDGRYIGAILDRNGLRPSRFYVTKNNMLVMTSEVNVCEMEDPKNIVLKSSLKPGRMLLADVTKNIIIKDDDLKKMVINARPYKEWLQEQMFSIDDLKDDHIETLELQLKPCSLIDKRLPLFGYSDELLKMQLIPMITEKKEGVGSMGNDTPLACLSHFRPLLFDYFKQLFAQVTNPPVDSIREKVLMSLECPIGPQTNILEPNAKQAHRLWLKSPILSIRDLEVLKQTKYKNWSAATIDTTYSVLEGARGFKEHLNKICKAAEAASQNHQILILSDRSAGNQRVPVSIVLAMGAVHHHLIDARTRMKVALLVETAEAKLVHDMCVLLGYGADGICPYLPLKLAVTLKREGILDRNLTDEIIFQNYSTALQVGILNVMAKMGISTLQSYKGAQIFEAVGLGDDIITKCFKDTSSRIGGLTMNMLAAEMYNRHRYTYRHLPDSLVLRDVGNYYYRVGGEKHVNTPKAIALLQEAATLKNLNSYNRFVEENMDAAKNCFLRGQMKLKTLDEPLSLSEIEPATDIVKRFSTGAMSFGSLGIEAHETLAIAMNKISAKSNSGEGGEIPERYLDPQKRSAIKQIASARFGVTSSYIAHASELQIKIAQGAKAGEGGEISQCKVTPAIAKLRRSVPGHALVSPPPHHDIYCIEDLLQLVHDLRCANPSAIISVKLASAVGVGIVATGVAKCKATHVIISGHDGGTGASSWTSIKNVGLPWEMGIAETHQVLRLNNLRSRMVLQADGHIRTGFDVIVAALLGADEVSLSTAPLIAMGCIMTRKCHLNICPVGIATQDQQLRKKFVGLPEHIINYIFMLAEDVRQHMARLGVKKFQDLIGRTDLLTRSNTSNCRAEYLNLNSILYSDLQKLPEVKPAPEVDRMDSRLDYELIKLARDVIDGKEKSVKIQVTINNNCRSFASTLSYNISKKYSENGLPKDSHIDIRVRGSAGQSFCAFLAKGITCTLEGDANDYAGKGLSGGTMIMYPSKQSPFESHKNVITGNVCLYGATSGKAFLRGIAGERFAVRNSGATAVVEGVGDHACEYMTGGTVLILGPTGKNFASGMISGMAFVWDANGSLAVNCNLESVELRELIDKSDVDLVKDLLYEFVKTTSSVIAKKLLHNFEERQKEFVKVCSPELQRGEGEDEDDDEKDGEEILDSVRGFMKYPPETNIYRQVRQCTSETDELYNFPHILKGLRKQAARCMDCATPFCQSETYGCPLGIVVPKVNHLVLNNRWKDALAELLQNNNFPEFTGRICPALCESACVLNISSSSVTVRNIECAVINYAYENGLVSPIIPNKRTRKRVAVVGSGPAGLTCASQLNKVGHLITVYERQDRAGGLLVYGIPNMKLNKALVENRIEIMISEGITFKTKTSVGKDISAEELSAEYDAVVLCIGVKMPIELAIRGRQLTGIQLALDFLEQCQLKEFGSANRCPDLKDKHVVVIGGGACAIDCIAVCINLKPASIKALEMNPKPPERRQRENPWPQASYVQKLNPIHQCVQNIYGSDPRIFNTVVTDFIDDGKGKVSAVRTMLVDWENSSGKMEMKKLPGSEKTVLADFVIVAAGFDGVEKTIGDQLQLEYTSEHYFKTENYRTKRSNVFAAGDCRRGESLVVWAIFEGREVARQVDEFLMKKESNLPGSGGLIPVRYCSPKTRVNKKEK